MNSAPNIITVENPCPVAAFRLKQKPGGLYCKSCHKTLKDFRESTTEEINSQCDENTCGIFYNDQVVTPTFSIGYRIKYLLLTVLSVLGLNVSPLQAQKKNNMVAIPSSSQRQIEKDKQHPNPPARFEPIKLDQIKTNQIQRKKKKKAYRTIGCPSF